MNLFGNPNLPEIDDYYEPFTFDYEHLQSAPESKTTPTARPRSLITGKRMEKIEWGPNWEEILGGEFAKRSKEQQIHTQAEIVTGFHDASCHITSAIQIQKYMTKHLYAFLD